MAIRSVSSSNSKKPEPRSDPLGPSRPLNHLMPKAPAAANLGPLSAPLEASPPIRAIPKAANLGPLSTPLVASPPTSATIKAVADKFKHPPST
jgi:hypothetical protein